MKKTRAELFLSYSGDDRFEASLLQYALESMLADVSAKVWTYQRDQSKSQRSIARSLKYRVHRSRATIFLVSPTTLDSGATQWMELAYSDAFEVPTFVLLHHLDYQEVKAKERGVPPLLLSSQCTPALDWKNIVEDIRGLLKKERNSD